MILLIVGVILIGYGIYTMISPEASIDLGVLSLEAQDNTDSYITIILGIVAVALGFIGWKK